MEKAQWQLLRTAFARAHDLPAAERAAFIAAFDREHAALAGKLGELLSRSDGETRLRDVIAAGAADVTASEPHDIWLNRDVGPWRIVRRIASGGMGAVFLAERADSEYAQSVAIKVMSTQLLAPEAVARFKSERQILANLKHPYIAGLLDGGTTDDGLPYLVMEYIDGLPIDVYCRSAGLDTKARLDLFRKVCEAVDFAHRNLVVHRDLKPGNILIDDSGNPKLLDFGIAKLIDSRAFQQPVAQTRTGLLVMTPEYASPEQVRGEPVSVASDVYALGALLFRLLTGQSPYGGDLTTPGSYERAILEIEPRKPSTAVTAAPTQISEAPEVSAAQLRSVLVGDLDTIVLRALQKDPERRYRNVVDFSRDIERHLRHEPIEARADDWWYKGRKFLRRHAARVTATSIVFLAGIALVTFFTLRVTQERDRANRSAAKAQEVAEFLTSLFEGASPNIQAGKDVSAVDLLEQGQMRIEALKEQPELQAELMEIIADSSTALGRYDVSIPMLERALQMQEALSPPDNEAISNTANSLAEAYRQNGQLEKSESYARRAIELAIQVFGPDHYNVAFLRMRLGVTLFDAGKTEEALTLKQQALDQLIAMGEGDSAAAVDARGNLANVLARLGRFEEAMTLSGEVATQSVTIQGPDHPNTIIRFANYARELNRMGRFDEARALLDEYIPRAIAVWGRDYDMVALMLRSRGSVKRRSGDFESALDDYEEARNIVERITNEDSGQRGFAWRGMGLAYAAADQLDDARDAFEKALAIARRAEGGQQFIPYDEYWLGYIAFEQGDLAASKQWHDRAMTRVDMMSASHRLGLMRSRVQTLTALGEFDAAAPLVDLLVTQDDSIAHLSALAAATTYYRRRGDCPNALATGQRIKRALDASDQPTAWEDALSLSEYGLALAACGQADAQEVLVPAIELLRGLLGADDRRVERLVTWSRESGNPGTGRN